MRTVEEWYPKKDYRSEAEYRDDLIASITEKLKRGSIWSPPERHRIRKESGRHLADIGIDEKIGIELKRNLNSQSKLDRLVGQIRRFMREYEYLIIVLCGKTNKGILDDLRCEFRDYSGGGWTQTQTVVKIIAKPSGQKRKREKGPKGLVDLFEEIE